MKGRHKMFKIFSKSKPLPSTPFSEFIRNAKAGEKKRVYVEVMQKATDRQNAVIRQFGVTSK